MDGRGAWRDNVFVQRPWRSVKCERVYLKAYDSVSAARADIADYLTWYKAQRAHSKLSDLTPDEHYLTHMPSCEWPHKMSSVVCPELPTASVGSSQGPTAVVDSSALCASCPLST